MKKQFFLMLVIFFFISFFASGQMFLGQHLNTIKKEHPVGSLEVNEDYGYTYGVTVEKDEDYYLYFVNKELNCYRTVLQPLTSRSLQAWIEQLNKQWVIVDSYNWKFYRNDGNIIYAEFRKIPTVEKPVIGFSYTRPK